MKLAHGKDCPSKTSMAWGIFPVFHRAIESKDQHRQAEGWRDKVGKEMQGGKIGKLPKRPEPTGAHTT